MLTSLTGEVKAEQVSIECLIGDVLDRDQDQLTRSDKVICFSLKSSRHTLEPVPEPEKADSFEGRHPFLGRGESVFSLGLSDQADFDGCEHREMSSQPNAVAPNQRISDCGLCALNLAETSRDKY